MPKKYSLKALNLLITIFIFILSCDMDKGLIDFINGKTEETLIYNDDFENQLLLDMKWFKIDPGNEYKNTKIVTLPTDSNNSNQPKKGNKCLSLERTPVSMTNYLIFCALNEIIPTRITFYMKPCDSGQTYFDFVDQNSNLILISAGLAYNHLSINGVPFPSLIDIKTSTSNTVFFQADKWLFFEIKNINYKTFTYDIIINKRYLVSGCSFVSHNTIIPPINKISRINLHIDNAGLSNTKTYIDDICFY